ncbi:heme peroxidase [Crassisporium funariophilum]|nr:heme peroxidase [Crassisporium funariophilum]
MARQFSGSLVWAILAALVPRSLGYQWPSPRYEALEALLYEGSTASGDFATVVNDCKRRTENPQKSTVAAEWLRFAYHDSATFDAERGLGGLDASINYELNRPENIGEGMTLTRRDYQFISGKYVSRADVIALGATLAVASCGGPIIPFRGGRVDASQAGPPGVPEPHQDLATHREKFRLQGFNPTEMIALVACGHTLGAVRSADFPNIVPPPNNTVDLPRLEHFDSTVAFDNTVVTEYLDGTTQNPLIVDGNATVRSDLRIFSSDNNITMRSISSPDSFQSTCKVLLERMLNSVGTGITLTEEIKLLDGKVSDAQLTFEDNALFFKANLRLSDRLGTTPPEGRTVRLYWCDRYGDAADCATGTVNTAISGLKTIPSATTLTKRLETSLTRHHFLVPVDSSRSISKFWFEVDDSNKLNPPRIYDNAGEKYKVAQDSLVHANTLGNVKFVFSNGTSSREYRVVVGIREGLSPSSVYTSFYDSTDLNAAPPTRGTVNMKLDSTTFPSSDGFAFYSGNFAVTALTGTSIDVHAGINGVDCTVDNQVATRLGGNGVQVPHSAVEIVPL